MKPSSKSHWTAGSLGRLGAPEILNSLADGAYVTDAERNILFWNRAAERITGWGTKDVVGKSCYDNVLVHVDKDGHQLCGKDSCPLHRSITTGQSSTEPLLVFAQCRDGRRVPVEVTVAPILDARGKTVGGIELFRDLTAGVQDMMRAQMIQQHELDCRLPEDGRVKFDIRYVPSEIVGGDFYRVERLDADRYAVMVADVMGHGVAAALYTMQLRSLWEDFRAELASPASFLDIINRRLHALARDAGYFATASFFCFHAGTGELRHVSAGHPPPLLLRRDGRLERLEEQQPALGMFPDTEYGSFPQRLDPGDSMLLYTDGAVEVANAAEEELGVDGLARLLAGGALDGVPSLDCIEAQLLAFSSQIRLPDDLTLLALHRPR
jgi:PAS domain S-box-containing protein